MARKQKAALGKKGQTRYAQVAAILDAAAAGSTADYGGAGRFWDDLATLETVSVHGVRMIAPSAEASCCGEGGGRSRSERSGLIQGLRGEPPFDGRRFPPLLWGGKRVADADIAFIADWIDDGCPAADGTVTELPAPKAQSDEQQVQLADVKEFGVMEWPDWIASRPGTPRQRGNLDCMSEGQLERLRAAFRCIFDLDPHEEDRRNYNNQALIHQNHCQHGWERFLPWHRAYLYEFEQNLQDFFPNVTLPYWDWTLPNYQPDAAPRDLIPRAFQAYLTEDAATAMIGDLRPRPTPSQTDAFMKLAQNRVRFTSQHAFFVYVVDTIGYTDVLPDPTNKNRARMLKALLDSNALWYPLRYPADYGGGTIANTFRMHFPSADDMAEILSLNNFRDFGGGSVYDAAFGFLDQNPHNTMHIWTGGMNPDLGAKTYGKAGSPHAASAAGDPATAAARRNATARIAGRKFHRGDDLRSQPPTGDMLSNLTASYDPVFWPIHVNIDRVWWEWQKLNPNALPADLDSILSPWNYTIRNMLDIAPFGYEYVRGSFFMPVGLEAPVARFVSKPIRLDAAAKGFRKAEVRLHWVPQLMRSCFVRAFLNQPGADAATPLQGNPHFAGYLSIFGHGACYGGPGHCDPPPPRPRDYDLRTRSHNTPRNHRIDVTKAAKRLLEHTDQLRITLLVIGADYQEDHELLKLEGVSLNLLD
jgi:tyrosinase